MSYGVKYRITFQDDFPNNLDIWENIAVNWEDYLGTFSAGYSWQLDILLDGYAGAVTSLTTSGRKASGTPLIIRGDSNDDDPLFPILSTEIIAEFFADSLFEFEAIFDANERTYQYILYLNSVVEGKGWIVPDGGYDFYSDTPYRVGFRGIDGLSQLKGIPYDDDGTPYAGTQTILSIILNCVNKVGLDLNLYTAVNFWEENMNTSNDPLGQIWIDADTWVTDGETMNCYDVLSELAYRFNANVFQRSGVWYFVRAAQIYTDTGDGDILTTLAGDPIQTLEGDDLIILGSTGEFLPGYTRREYEYSTSGTLIGTETYKPNVTAGGGTGYTLRAINQDQIVMTRQAWKKATIVYDHGYIPNIVIDGGFEPSDFTSGTYLLLTNWLINGSITFVGVFQTDVEGSIMGLRIATEVATEDVYEANYLLNSATRMVWDDSDAIVIRMSFKFIDYADVADAKWYYTLRMTDSATATAYYFNGSTWSTTPDFSATLTSDVLAQQTTYEESFALPTAFNNGNFQMQLHGVFDAGSAASPKVIIDSLEAIHYNPNKQRTDSGVTAKSITVFGSASNVVTVEGQQDLITGEGRTNHTKGAWLMNSGGTTLPGTWARAGKTETKTLDQINIQSIMNTRTFGNRIIEGSYKGYPRYGDIVLHDRFDNRYFMMKRFNFDCKKRKGTISIQEIKDVDVDLTYTTIIE